MSNGSSAPTLLVFSTAGSLSVGALPLRYIVPFNYQVIGASASAVAAPTGADVIFDILHYANDSMSGVSLWPTNNGTGGKPDLRPRIKAGRIDQAANTVPPSYEENGLIEYPFLAVPDVSGTPTQLFVGNQPANNPGLGPPTIQINEVEAATANWPQELPNNVYGYFGVGGDAFEVNVIQVGSSVAGANASVLLWLALV